jgi:hypothetical protein
MNYGDKERIHRKGCYFVRTSPEGKPVDPGSGSAQILFGEISDKIIVQLSALMTNLYSQSIGQLQPEE